MPELKTFHALLLFLLLTVFLSRRIELHYMFSVAICDHTLADSLHTDSSKTQSKRNQQQIDMVGIATVESDNITINFPVINSKRD